MENLRVAIIHDWLVTYGGAERVLEEILTLFPDADLYSLIDCLPGDQRKFLSGRKVTTSFLQNLPRPGRWYRKYLAMMPLAIEQFNLSNYDLVISSSHAVAKGVLTRGDQLHISYFNGLMNYVWGQYHFYLKDAGLDRGVRSWLAKLVLHRVRLWDMSTANRVDHYVANSEYMARDIRRIYGRTATVIHPPVDTDSFAFAPDKEDYYVVVGRLVPIKRVDLIVRAFAQMPERRLIVIGDGPERKKLQALAGDNIEFLGYRDRSAVASHMAGARALITASVEPFGISSVEAQACGTPVIAYARGGVRETIIEDQTGLFFKRESSEDIVEAVNRFEASASQFDPEVIRKNALRFSRENFRKKFMAFVETVVPQA